MSRRAPVHWKVLQKILLAQGFRFARQEGSHRSSVKPGISRPIVIPAYDQAPISIIKNNLKTAGISREDYLALIQNIAN